MRLGERIAERRRALGFSQSRLAREAGVSQPTIGKLEIGMTSGSSQLHRIARALRTTPAYLTGEIDDPAADAPSPTDLPATDQKIIENLEAFKSAERDLLSEMIQALAESRTKTPAPLQLPDEPTLTATFRGLVRGIDLSLPLDDIAQLLARRLPIALAKLQSVSPEVLGSTDLPEQPSPEPSPEMRHPAPQS